MSHMFANDFALNSIPDISKWNVLKVKDMEHMFTHCGIIEFPDISKWDMSNIENMSYMFSYCINLKEVPNLPEWNIVDANVRGMFYGCNSLWIFLRIFLNVIFLIGKLQKIRFYIFFIIVM